MLEFEDGELKRKRNRTEQNRALELRSGEERREEKRCLLEKPDDHVVRDDSRSDAKDSGERLGQRVKLVEALELRRMLAEQHHEVEAGGTRQFLEETTCACYFQ